jgi:Sec-independent protein secretion pathway component TatC
LDNKFSAYGKYAGIVFQMAAIILLFTWIGIQLDEMLAFQQPYMTALFALIGVFISIWQVIQSLMKMK